MFRFVSHMHVHLGVQHLFGQRLPQLAGQALKIQRQSGTVFLDQPVQNVLINLVVVLTARHTSIALREQIVRTKNPNSLTGPRDPVRDRSGCSAAAPARPSPPRMLPKGSSQQECITIPRPEPPVLWLIDIRCIMIKRGVEPYEEVLLAHSYHPLTPQNIC